MPLYKLMKSVIQKNCTFDGPKFKIFFSSSCDHVNWFYLKSLLPGVEPEERSRSDSITHCSRNGWLPKIQCPNLIFLFSSGNMDMVEYLLERDAASSEVTKPKFWQVGNLGFRCSWLIAWMLMAIPLFTLLLSTGIQKWDKTPNHILILSLGCQPSSWQGISSKGKDKCGRHLIKVDHAWWMSQTVMNLESRHCYDHALCLFFHCPPAAPLCLATWSVSPWS